MIRSSVTLRKNIHIRYHKEETMRWFIGFIVFGALAGAMFLIVFPQLRNPRNTIQARNLTHHPKAKKVEDPISNPGWRCISGDENRYQIFLHDESLSHAWKGMTLSATISFGVKRHQAQYRYVSLNSGLGHGELRIVREPCSFIEVWLRHRKEGAIVRIANHPENYRLEAPTHDIPVFD